MRSAALARGNGGEGAAAPERTPTAVSVWRRQSCRRLFVEFQRRLAQSREILLAIVERFTSIGEAEAAVTALDAGGIEVMLFDDWIVALNWMYSNALGGIKVVIREEDYEAAADILDFPAEETEEPEKPQAQKETTIAAPHCPSCGLTTITLVAKFEIFAALAILLAAVGVVLSQLGLAALAIAVLAIVLVAMPSHRCTTCGKAFTWNDRPNVDESPLPQDLIDDPCPNCGSLEIHRIEYRRFKALTLFQPLILLVVFWPFLPKRKCDTCGRRSY